MRILIFTNDFPPAVGGIQAVAFYLAQYAARAGQEVLVLARAHAGAEAFDIQQAFRVRRFRGRVSGAPWMQLSDRAGALRALAETARAEHPDAILCIQWDPCAYIARALCATLLHGIPYFVIAHGMEIVQERGGRLKRRLKAALRHFALAGARRIIAVSIYTRDRVVAQGIGPSRVVVIPNAVAWRDDLLASGAPRRREAAPVLLSMSRLVARKGQDVLLQALPQVIERYPALVCHIAGDGPERTRLERTAQQSGLAGHVIFHGTVQGEEKERLLEACDLFVLPVREIPGEFEPFGIVYLEAMQHGKAVIAGRSGGIPEVVRDGRSGVLVDPCDPNELAASILRLLEDPAEAERLGRNGLQSVRERFRWDVVVQEYLAVMGGAGRQ